MPEPAHPKGVHVSRRMWRALEPYHAVVFFIPETREQTDALGLKGGWMSYFACRAAPLGAVRAEVVAALFYVFHPDMVSRAIPDAWSLASPEALVEARLAAVDQGLRPPPSSAKHALGAEAASRLESLVQPLREKILASGGFPVPNPTGIT